MRLVSGRWGWGLVALALVACDDGALAGVEETGAPEMGRGRLDGAADARAGWADGDADGDRGAGGAAEAGTPGDAAASADVGQVMDSARADAGPGDAGPGDAGPGDAGPGDAGPEDALPGAADQGGGADAGGAVRRYPALPTYSQGECPALVGGSTTDTSVVRDFVSGDQVRSFRLMVPSDYDGTRPLPLVFAWHWLNASSSSFVREAELESAVDQMQFIAVLPDARRNDNGDRTYLLSWPFAEVWGVPAEELFFDDLLACVTEQFNVDLERVYGIGVSAGALWLTYLITTARAEYFAAVEVLSGGLGDMLGVWRMEYQPQPRKFPAIVLWGGPGDWLALSFHDASIRLRDALVADDHFVVECVHDAGHAVPPADPPPGDTKFRFLWTFMFDHPYSQPTGVSPYQAEGLPASFPEWCRIASPAP